MFRLQFLALALAAIIPQITATPTPALLTLPYPLFPQSSPAPAVVLGVDSQGHTTYAVEEDEIDYATSGGPPFLPTTTIPITGTLVAGADHAAFTFSADDGITLESDCDYQGGNAVLTFLGSNFVLDVVSTASPNISNSSPRLSTSFFCVLGSTVTVLAAWVALNV
ncbi:hypothetical protein K438DRAFT_1964032 [Mycena galopus ATCC 62051]|nr:hypothetical protein K438DRAFT_1964032 [Mycena galopus ATCC 62051]